METVRELLARLVAIDSSSPRTNAPIIGLLEQYVAGLGFVTRRLPYIDAAGVEKINLVALSDEREPPALALVGHTDAVPFDPEWKEALTLTEANGKLVGRGACDTKGFIACALAATAAVDRSKLARPLALVFTADEETGCFGAMKLAEAGAVHPKFAIVGEPTSLTPVRAHKGYSLAEIEVIGREGHSAHPERGVSAIFVAAELLARIETLARTLTHEGDPEFQPPHTTINVGRIQGGRAANIIPGSCRFTLEWRSIPGQPAARVIDVVSAAARDVAQARGVEVKVTPIQSGPGVDTPKSSELVRFLEERSGRNAVTVSFGTEAPQLTELGAQSVVFGPGDIGVAHRTGEFVPVDELERCREILQAAIERFCG